MVGRDAPGTCSDVRGPSSRYTLTVRRHRRFWVVGAILQVVLLLFGFAPDELERVRAVGPNGATQEFYCSDSAFSELDEEHDAPAPLGEGANLYSSQTSHSTGEVCYPSCLTSASGASVACDPFMLSALLGSLAAPTACVINPRRSRGPPSRWLAFSRTSPRAPPLS